MQMEADFGWNYQVIKNSNLCEEGTLKDAWKYNKYWEKSLEMRFRLRYLSEILVTFNPHLDNFFDLRNLTLDYHRYRDIENYFQA